MGRVIALCLCLLAAAAQAQEKIVITHRGASGYLPEHTLEAYSLAYAMGADFIEPDVVMTKDHRLIALHDIHLDQTTDVAERMPDRKRADGHWYAADFTLEEIKTLRAQERLANRFPRGAASFQLPTLEEVIELVQGLNKTTGRNTGIYPELKAPKWHEDNGLPLADAVLSVLEKYGYTAADARCYLQCFEPEALQAVKPKTALPLIQLIGSGAQQKDLWTEAGLAKIAAYAAGVGPDKKLVEAHPELIEKAHALNLRVHPYTVRKDQVASKYTTCEEELKQFFFTYNVDGLFTDHPDAAVQVLCNR